MIICSILQELKEKHTVNLLTLSSLLLATPKKVLIDLVVSFLGSDYEGLVFG